jgi:hypothetical protein
MTILGREKIVVLGMMSRMRVGGAAWQVLHYLIGLRKLGYDPYYVEAHGCVPWAFRENESAAAEFVGSVLHRFDMSHQWAFHAPGGSGAHYGMSKYQLSGLYKSAAAILNLHGGTLPTPEQTASGRLVYIDTDPVAVQVDIYRSVQSTLDTLQQHCAWFTFAENYGKSDCKLPASEQFPFKPTRQPVVLDLWTRSRLPSADVFTTVGNWKQLRRIVEFGGEEYYWSKHFEFLKLIDLPGRTNQPLELALSGCDGEARALLLNYGWRVRDAFDFSHDLDAYREYIIRSKAEFTVAKDQNIRLRTGWFSDRSATYLAAGRPVVTQETGFSNILPAGCGLFGFSNTAEVLGAIDSINADYSRNQKAAEDIAREYFAHDVVLGQLLSELGVGRRTARARSGASSIAVNIVGDFQSKTGMRTTAERYMRALESIGVTVKAIDASARAPSQGDADINLICCEVASHFSIRSRFGDDFFRDRYNIGVWLWETQCFPNEWYDRFLYYDEIWAPTSFIASALSPISPVPVVRMPVVLEPGAPGNRSAGRGRLGIRDEEFVYLFVFNFYSRFQRKNPKAVIDAFKLAFSPEASARLVIKCANANFALEYFREMNRLAEGHRITLCDGQWSETEMSDLMAACDCYVSLHRAEGVGLTISDAMAAGKPVVATGWSGNMDFMDVSNSFPVCFRLVRLDADVAHYQAGDHWAEPSIEHAADILRYIFDHRDEAVKRGESARNHLQLSYSNKAIGALIAYRLGLVKKRQRFQLLKQCVGRRITDVSHFVDEFSDLGDYVPAAQFRYETLRDDLRQVVHSHVPPGATLAVVSKGDDELLNLDGWRAWPFPLREDHQYAGYYPKDSAEAIQQVEAVRAEGGDFLLFPKTGFWWLDHYAEFRQYLLTRYRLAHRDDSCVMFELR